MSDDSKGDDIGFDKTAAGPGAPVAAERSQDLHEGMVLNGTYELEHRLGQGGMGEVWKAQHLRLPKPVAIKVLLPDLGANDEVVQRFRREAEIGSRLAHPHIVHVFDFNELEDGRKYIAMDYLVGESLQERLDRGPLPLREIVYILKQASQALQVAHDAGVVHRDLKPDNIFLCADKNLDPPYRAKILDFGISKIQNAERALTQDLSVMGTPGYMAPEQAKGHTAQLGPSADQFSLATIAYEMVTGNAVFSGSTLVEIIFKVVHEDPAPIDSVAPDVSKAAADALAKAMAKEPDARFETVGDFVAAFTSSIDMTSAAVAPREETRDAQVTEEPAPSARTKTKTPWLFAGLALLVGGLALTWVALSGPKAADQPVATTSTMEASAPPAQAPLNATPPDSAVHDRIPDASLPSVVEKQKPPQRPNGPSAPALSGEAKSLLQQAEAALRTGDGRAALSAAQRSFRMQKSPQARAAMAKAYCLQQNLGGANSMKRGLRGLWKKRVEAFCKKTLN